jgi:hypothetical protein
MPGRLRHTKTILRRAGRNLHHAAMAAPVESISGGFR